MNKKTIALQITEKWSPFADYPLHSNMTTDRSSSNCPILFSEFINTDILDITGFNIDGLISLSNGPMKISDITMFQTNKSEDYDSLFVFAIQLVHTEKTDSQPQWLALYYDLTSEIEEDPIKAAKTNISFHSQTRSWGIKKDKVVKLDLMSPKSTTSQLDLLKKLKIPKEHTLTFFNYRKDAMDEPGPVELAFEVSPKKGNKYSFRIVTPFQSLFGAQWFSSSSFVQKTFGIPLPEPATIEHPTLFYPKP
jgi:hypothetical protein